MPPPKQAAVRQLVACTPVAGPGAVGASGGTGADRVLAGPVPAALVALTVKRYGLPLTRPPTRKLVTADARTVAPPVVAVMM